jgi:hypothetical protein
LTHTEQKLRKNRKSRSGRMNKCNSIIILSCIVLNCIISINLSLSSTQLESDKPIQADNQISDENNIPNSSDVAGTELYAEQISAYVAGDSAIIRHSFLTNDSNIFQNFDYNDPGFLDCNIVIAASNGISPKMFPSPFTSTIFGSENLILQDAFFGFLYYNTTHASNITLLERSRRAFNVLKETFNLEIIILENEESTTFYPFVAYYPDWKNLLNVITANTPNDGYWATIDKERLSSDDYLENHHISTVLLMLDSINVLLNGIPQSMEYFNFNLSNFDLSFMNFDALSGIFSGLFELLNISSSLLSSFDPNSLLGGDDKVITSILNYEAASGGVQYLGNNQYSFDLFRAINYDYEEKGPLAPSQKTFISLIGALLSEIDISFFSTDILSFEPGYVKFSEYIFDTIEMISFLAGIAIDTSAFQAYSMGIFWKTTGCMNQITTNIYNPDNQQDIVNLLRLVSRDGLMFIPTGILEPIDTFIINYVVNTSQPVLDIKKEYVLNSITDGSYDLKITVTNKGNITAWGQDLGQSLFDVSTITSLLPGWFSAFIEIIFGVPADEYFNLDQNPRFFMIDTYGTGTYDRYYPDPLATGAISLYRPDLGTLIMNPDYDLIFLTLGISPEQRQTFADTLSNPESIFNPDHWDLLPGESFSIIVPESLGSEYSFSPYYTFNFLQNGNLQPYLAYGTTVDSTSSTNALTYNKQYWNLSSTEIGGQNHVQVFFSFENTTILDPNMNDDRLTFEVSYKTNLTSTNPFSTYQLQYFNPYSGSYGNFVTIPTSNVTITNNIIRFTATQNLYQYYNVSNNYHSIFKLTLAAASSWKFSIDSVNLTFYDRDLKGIYQDPALLSFSTFSRHNTFSVESNSIIPVTDYAPILVATAYLEYPSSYSGQINTYFINITNSGNEFAKDINVSVPITGIIYNNGDFTLTDDIMETSVAFLDASDTVSLSFEFYSPNSDFIPKATIEYNNFNPINGDSADFVIKSNDFFLSAPIDYRSKIRTPFISVVNVQYTTNWSLAATPGGSAPLLGDHVELDINVTNEGETAIDWLEVLLPDHIKGFSRLDTNSLEINNLLPHTFEILTILLNKTEWNAYYYPGIADINASQRSTVQIKPFSPIILAYKHIELVKTFSDMDGDYGSRVIVTINIMNTGNLEFRNITVNDVNGFPKTGFRLQEGIIDKFISLLEPGESIAYSYTLSFNQQGIYNISSAKIIYGYLQTEIAYSNSLLIKVRNNWIVNAAWILVPSAIAFALTILLYWWKHRYDLEAADFERREQLMFGTDFRSSSWDKFIIEEHLKQIMEGKQITSLREREEVF